MFTSIRQFTEVWESETANTVELLERLTDESLALPDHKDVHSLGRAAWRIVTTYPETCVRFGIGVKGPMEKDPVPGTAARLRDAYCAHTDPTLQAVKRRSDPDLGKEDDMYRKMWPRGKSLWMLLLREIHHREQLSVLMRLAGLPVTGLYGPAREEWSRYSMSAPGV